MKSLVRNANFRLHWKKRGILDKKHNRQSEIGEELDSRSLEAYGNGRALSPAQSVS